MANNTSGEVGLDFILIDENDIFDKVVVSILWGFLEIPVNAGLFGLVQFDRLGGDPLKRRITDQVGKKFGIYDFKIQMAIFIFFSYSQQACYTRLFSTFLSQSMSFKLSLTLITQSLSEVFISLKDFKDIFLGY